MGAGTSASDVGSSTSGITLSINGTTPMTSGPCYGCKDWVSRISIGKLKSIDHISLLSVIWPSVKRC